MNKIYIVNDLYNNEIILNFKNNTFQLNNFFYNFSFEDKNMLCIKWDNSNNNENFYTEDSYLYFSDINLKNKFKKIFLINNQWNDQAILNIDKLTLNRIKHDDQCGTFIFDNNKLIINWNYWGIEKFIKKDEYLYISENYTYFKSLEDSIDNKACLDDSNNIICINSPENVLINNANKILITHIPIYIFIHICCIEDWEDIFNDQIDYLKKTGLFEKSDKIFLGILGSLSVVNLPIFNNKKFNILYIDQRINLYEIHTINFIKYICMNDPYTEDVNILYIHTKGVRNSGNKEVIKSWRKMMEYFLIEKHENCLKYLNIYDTIGVNAINLFCYNKDKIKVNKDHTYHYSGNFWWSKKSYINKLPYMELDLTSESINTRYKAENWILSKYPDANIGIIFQDDTNLHPYHRYVFEYYKEMDIFIKKLY